MKKTRIYEIKRKSGIVEYYPQYKGWLFWHYFDCYSDNTEAKAYIEGYSYSNKKLVICTDSIGSAKWFLVKYASLVKKDIKDKVNNKVVKTTLHKYP